MTSQIDPLAGGDTEQARRRHVLRADSASSGAEGLHDDRPVGEDDGEPDRNDVGSAEPHGGRPHWLVDCRDVANRACVITVLVDHGRVVLLGPPGETAVLTAAEVGRLRTVLHEAAELAKG
ncbi:hypothetical protein [Actinoalloteichus hoggarensis]|uniref:hypothetical protein n=1 Tax=Actinoalloteichus hoggarensis TaxID=1470176 RepID=UPI0012FE4118|nr:hypothetical protein [Actinoalloteichus hoggarensis]